MPRKSTTRDPYAKTHMAIANAIRKAKRDMFKSHREGMNLTEAINQFNEELSVELHCLEPSAADARTRVDDDPAAEEISATNARRSHYQRIQALAKAAVSRDDRKQQLALIRLLDLLTYSSDDAFTAKIAAFKECDALWDEALAEVCAKEDQKGEVTQ